MDPTERCPHCGTPLPAGALDGLCPACLLRQDTAGDSLPGIADAPEIGDLSRTFPQLEILGLLGRGGMGAVYKARQKHLDRFVALKILPPGVGRDPAFAARFEREAKALAKLQHPHIVTLYEFGKADELYYFLMEYVDGPNLRQVLQGSRLAPQEALAIVPPICDALQYAHDRGIVHRDIKPENILVGRDGQVKIADFGVAKIVGAAATADGSDRPDRSDRSERPAGAPAVTAPGRVVGTPAYMAPEQRANPGDVDHRADIYSLGVVFYQMLTGELPGKAWEPPSRKVVVDVRLDAVVLRALEQAPDRRYQHVSDVKTMVETIVASPRDAADRPPRAVAHGTRWSWLAFALAFAAHAVFALWSAPRLPARVATHFGFAGPANGWMGRGGYLLFITAVPLAQAVFFWWIGGIIRAVPPRFVSLPRRDYWLSPEHRDEAVTLLRRYLLVYAGILALFFAGLHLMTLRANAANPPVLEMGGLLLAVMAFLMATILWISLLLMRFAEVGGERPHVEGRAPRSPTARALGATRPSRGLRMAIAAALLLLALVFLPLPGFLLPSLGPHALARRQASLAEADVVLAPNRSLIEHVAAVDRIWGREITFSRVPLKRQDSGAAHDASETEDGTSPGLRPIPPTLMALVRDMEEAEASGKAGTVRQSASVGSVVERTLRYFGDGRGHDVLWLEDGSLSPLPTGFFDRGDASNRAWLRQRGPGVFPGTGIADGKAAHGLCGGGMVFAVVPNAWWDAPPAATALAAAVARSETVSRPALTTFAIQGGTLYLWPTDTPLPLTLVFQDDRGACGLLQVLAVRDAAGTTPVGEDTHAYAWTVRYRLAQSPGVTVLSDPTEVAVPRQESRLQFRLVAEERDPAFWEPLPCAPALNQPVLHVCTAVLLDESSVAAANVEPSPAGDPQVTLQLTETGKEAFARVTQNSVGRRLAIVLDGRVLSAPVVRTAITGGSAIISGAMTTAEAEAIAAQIRRAAEATAETAQRQRRQNDMRQILTGAALYAVENRGEWPATLSELSPSFGTDTALIARGDAEFSYRRPGPSATVREGDVERVVHPPMLCEKRAVGTDRLLVGFADGHTETVTDPEHLRELRAFFAQPVVVECVVHDLDDGVDQQALSLRTGRVLTVPPDFDHRGEQGRQWLTAQSVDLFVDQANSRWAILGLGLSFGDLPNEQWERTTVADAEAALAAGSRLLERIEHRDGLIHALPAKAKPPLTFAFRTRTGTLGVLQITGFSDAPQAMRLRYKLLRGPATPPVASPSASATPRDPVLEIAKPLNPASPPEPRTSAR